MAHKVAVLTATGGNITQAARVLDIERKTLHRQIARYQRLADAVRAAKAARLAPMAPDASEAAE